MNEQDENNLCCQYCVVKDKKGFLFKKEKVKVKVFSCTCLKNDSKLICENCKKNCHFTEGHESTELGEKWPSEFICSCKESSIEENKAYLSEMKEKCVLYELYKGDESILKHHIDKLEMKEDSIGKKPRKKYLCLFCIKSENEELFNENENFKMGEGKVCWSVNKKAGIQYNFEKIFKFIKDIPSVDSEGKHIHLIQIFQKIYYHPTFKVYFNILEETVRNPNVQIKKEKKKKII